MFAKLSLIAAILSVAAHVAAQTPPGCLIGAMSTQPNPADLQAVCGNATQVESAISSGCGSAESAALSAFTSVCKSAGMTVSASMPASTSSATGSGSSTNTMSTTSSASGSAPVNTKSVIATSPSGFLSVPTANGTPSVPAANGAIAPIDAGASAGATGSPTASPRVGASTGAAGKVGFEMFGMLVLGAGALAFAL